MRSGGGKQKGAAFEREICVLLSSWLTNGAQEDVFWRSAMSGGRATVAFKKGKRLASQVGDISCISPVGERLVSRFALECKFYSDLDYPGLVTGKGKLLTFWGEITKQAEQHGKLPILFARQNRLPTMVCLGYFGLNQLQLSWNSCDLISPTHDIFMMNADKFFTDCKPFV